MTTETFTDTRPVDIEGNANGMFYINAGDTAPMTLTQFSGLLLWLHRDYHRNPEHLADDFYKEHQHPAAAIPDLLTWQTTDQPAGEPTITLTISKPLTLAGDALAAALTVLDKAMEELEVLTALERPAKVAAHLVEVAAIIEGACPGDLAKAADLFNEYTAIFGARDGLNSDCAFVEDLPKHLHRTYKELKDLDLIDELTGENGDFGGYYLRAFAGE